jgi:hypothetical protein
MRRPSLFTSTLVPFLKKPLVIGGLVVCGAAFWASTMYNSVQSMKSHNTIFRGIIMHLNKSKEATDLIGDHIVHNESIPVKGKVNIVKGNADLEFAVTGDKDEATVIFKGNRMKNCDFWESNQGFTLKNKMGTIEL